MTDPALQQKRLTAAAIDGGVLMGLLVVAGGCLSGLGVAVSMADMAGYGLQVGSLALATLSALYILARDVVAGGRSVGKKIMEIRTVTAAGTPIGVVESVKRNAVFAPPFVLWVLSVLIGMIPGGTCIACVLLPLQLLAGAAALAAVVWEAIQIIQDPDGVRLGDKLAGTRVTV
jgi:hypothetical protein